MLREQRKNTNKKVKDLENFVDELDDRHLDQEANTSKIRVQIMNLRKIKEVVFETTSKNILEFEVLQRIYF